MSSVALMASVLEKNLLKSEDVFQSSHGISHEICFATLGLISDRDI